MSTPTLLDIRQVAAILGLSVGAAYRRHQRGQLPAPVRIGRSLRWRQEDIAAMLEPVKALVEYHRGAMIAGQAQHENEEQVTRILERSGSEWVLTQAAHDAGYRLLDCAVSQVT